MKKTFRTTTALIASLNLAVPFPALAQADQALENAVRGAAEACAADSESPACTDALNQALGLGATDEDVQTRIEGGAEGNGNATAEPAAPVEGETDAEAEVEAETQADAEGVADPVEGGAEVEAEAETESEIQTEAPELPSAETLEQSLSDAEAEATAGAEALVEEVTEPAQDAQTEVAPIAENGNVTMQEAPTEQPAAPEAQSEPAPEAESDMATEAEAEPAPEAEAEAEADVTTDAEAAPAPEAESDETAEAEATTEGEAEAEAEAEGGQADAEAQSAEADDTAPVTTIEQDTSAETEAAPDAQANAMTEAEQAAVEGQAPVAPAAAEDSEAVETETTTVTEAEARSSSEDFETKIDRTPEKADAEDDKAEDSAKKDDDDGLSKLEKALLVGAGALAVGALLNGNRRVVASSDDRVVVSGSDGGYELIKDDNALLAQPGAEVQTQTFNDGSTRTTVNYEDGSKVVTIRDAQLRVVRRVRVTPNGEEIVLIDDLNENIQPVNVQQLQQTAQPSRTVDLQDEEALRQALATTSNLDRAYSLSQVRNIQEVRAQVPAVDLEAITFDTGSAAIRPAQADELRGLGQYIRQTIAQNPKAIFLVEGHTDAVGDAAYNLALSDRRAESVALALSEYFDVPTSNLVVQGYGERFLKVETSDAERANRRATVRNITPLLQIAAAN